MPDDTLERLSETMGIDREILKIIQSEGFTIVRTDDIKKRKHFTAIIENVGISI